MAKRNEIQVTENGSMTVTSHLKPTLQTIPFEIRLMIFKHLLSSVTVRRGFGKVTSNHTSILQSCRQYHTEAKDLFRIELVPLCFRSTAVMLDYLTALTPLHLQQIRHIRFRGFPIVLQREKHIRDLVPALGLSRVLALVPGLQLDCLVIEDCFHLVAFGHPTTRDIILDLMSSKGWRELHYIVPSTRFIRRFRPAIFGQNQPENWQKRLRTFEGGSSTAEVKIYVADAENITGMAENPNTRTEYSTALNRLEFPYVPNPGWNGTAQTSLNSGLKSENREVIVIAKRGEGSPSVEDGVREGQVIYLNSLSWKEIREGGYYVDIERNDLAQFLPVGRFHWVRGSLVQ